MYGLYLQMSLQQNQREREKEKKTTTKIEHLIWKAFLTFRCFCYNLNAKKKTAECAGSIKIALFPCVCTCPCLSQLIIRPIFFSFKTNWFQFHLVQWMIFKNGNVFPALITYGSVFFISFWLSHFIAMIQTCSTFELLSVTLS